MGEVRERKKRMRRREAFLKEKDGGMRNIANGSTGREKLERPHFHLLRPEPRFLVFDGLGSLTVREMRIRTL